MPLTTITTTSCTSGINVIQNVKCLKTDALIKNECALNDWVLSFVIICCSLYLIGILDFFQLNPLQNLIN